MLAAGVGVPTSPSVRVGELCNRDVVFATADEAVADAARRLISRHVGALVVVDDVDDVHHPVGVVTDRDLVAATLVGDVGHVRSLCVGDLMTKELVTATQDEDVFDAMQRMRARGVRRLPVVDANRALVGILTLDDLIEWLGEQLSELTRLVANELRRERERERD